MTHILASNVTNSFNSAAHLQLNPLERFFCAILTQNPKHTHPHLHSGEIPDFPFPISHFPQSCRQLFMLHPLAGCLIMQMSPNCWRASRYAPACQRHRFISYAKSEIQHHTPHPTPPDYPGPSLQSIASEPSTIAGRLFDFVSMGLLL